MGLPSTLFKTWKLGFWHFHCTLLLKWLGMELSIPLFKKALRGCGKLGYLLETLF